MSKSTVTRLFVGATLTLIAGTVVLIATAIAAVAGGVISLGGPSVVTINGAAFAGAVGWLLIAGLVIGAGSVAAVVSWFGALTNTYRLEDKTWFGALLVLGLVSFGWIAMVAYVVAGPDGMAPQDPATRLPAVAAE